MDLNPPAGVCVRVSFLPVPVCVHSRVAFVSHHLAGSLRARAGQLQHPGCQRARRLGPSDAGAPS